MKRTIIILALFSFIMASYGQSNEANIWVFGKRAGLNFNVSSGYPVPYSGINTYFIAQEGCASIASSGGDLLFYTDGQQVWNKQNEVMDNGTGLLGHMSSTQSGIIVPKPDNPNIYYVFTVPYQGDPVGLRYSVVDISQNGGLGKVIEKNSFLTTPVTEKVTAMKHENNEDIWVITHKWRTFKITGGDTTFYPSDTILSYLVTEQGIDPNPVISKVGRKCGGSWLNTVGYLKGAPSGDRLAMAVFYSDYYQLFDFSAATGEVSNPITFDGYKYAYGVEFSPNSRYLYLTAEDSANFKKMNIYQFDLFAGDSNAIKSSGIKIGYIMNNSAIGRGALQVGPDQKIYVARGDVDSIAVINNPNLRGTQCDLDPHGIELGINQYCQYGLPTFIQTYFAPPKFTYDHVCWGDQTQFTITSDITGYLSVEWNFGDGGVSNLVNPVHQYANWGNYVVTLVVTYASTERTAEEVITILSKPTANFSYDPYCFGAPTQFHDLSVPNGGSVDGWIWDFGDGGTSDLKNPQHTFTTQGQHTVKLTVTTNNGCISDVKTLTVNQIPPPAVSATPTGPNKMCENGPNTSYNTTGASDAVSYIWNLSPAGAGIITGSTKNATVNWTDTYAGIASITVTSVNQCNENSAPSGALQVNVTALPTVFAGIDTAIWYDSPYYFADAAVTGNGPFNYQWEPADSLLDNTVLHPTTIYLKSSNLFTLSVWDVNTCYEEDAMLVKIKGGPLGVSIITDRDSICWGGQTQLYANPWGGSGDYSFEWSCDTDPGWHSTVQTIMVAPDVTSTYTVEVDDGINDDEYSITVKVIALPVAEAGEDISINWGTTAQLNGSATGGAGGPYEYLWSPEGWCVPQNTHNPMTVQLFNSKTFSLEITDRFGCKDTDEVTVHITGGPITASPSARDTIICYGDSTLLFANPGGGSGIYDFFRWRPRILVADSTAETTYTTPLYITTDFIVRVQDDFGNEAHDTVTVMVNPLPETLLYPESVPIIDDPVKVCVYDTLLLRPYQGNKEVNYLWNNGSFADTMQVQTTGVGVEIQTYWVRTEFVETGCINHDTVTFIFTFDDCVGIGDIEDNSAFMLFPNPADEMTYLLTKGLQGDYTLRMEDMKGVVVREEEIYLQSENSGNQVIDLKDFSPGIYLVRIFNSRSVYVNKLIIR
ncbi:MAG TPA: PKD domain-containing protein [Bacteroidales bacterium]|nr:PKD domain-containing protein [Bacteroidales bacterium]